METSDLTQSISKIVNEFTSPEAKLGEIAKSSVDNLARFAVNALNPTKPPHEGYNKVYIETKLAVEFGSQESLESWVKDLDDQLATASFFAIKEIKQKQAYEWENTVAALNNCDALVQIKDSHRRSVKTWSKSTTDFFKFDGSADSEDVEKLATWFKEVMCEFNPKIYENSTLVREGVVEKLAAIANETGARVESFESFFTATDSHRDRVLEISIIRFPTKDEPHILLYRLEVDAWFKCNRILFAEDNRAGFEVDVQEMKFKLNDKIAGEIEAEHVKKMKAKLSDESTYNF